MFEIEFSETALVGLAKLRKSEPASFKKVEKLLDELRQHPMTGTGHPELLKGMSASVWSRRISNKHRLVYEIIDSCVKVIILTAYGHYADK